MAFQQFAGALYVGNRSSGSFEAGPSTLLVPGATTAAGNSAASVRGGSSDEEAVRLKFENPFVKLQRLQEELKEFDSELREAAKQQPKTGAAAGGGQASAASDAAQGIWTNLTANVQQLQGQLDAMLEQPQVKQLLQPHQGSAAAAAAAATHSSSLLPHFDSLFEAYVAELTADPSFQPFPDTATAAPPASTAATGSASSAELAALPRLDERVHALEKLLGASATGATAKQPQIPQLSFSSGAASASSPSNSASSVSASVSVLPAPDLVSALSSLHTQLLQLNPQRMEFVSRACKQILIEQESIALATKQNKEDAAAGGAASTDKKEDGGASAAADASAKPYAAQVSHLYALTSRWDTLALTLPSLISRLSSLHGLHAASATLASRVSTLERQSGAIDAALTAQRDGIEALASTAKENIAALHANFKAMDARIQQINQKIEQLRS
jgi:predicted  nucleic acid-binding Zn-ribbon protein